MIIDVVSKIFAELGKQIDMQKLWSGKGKRSQPSPTEDSNSPDPTVMQDFDQGNTNPSPTQNDLESFPDTTENLPEPNEDKIAGNFLVSRLIFAIGIGGVILVTMLGVNYLTAPESTPDSNLACKSKIGGDWQTPLGKLHLEEKGNEQVLGKYAYSNFERGNIMGEFTGKLRNNVIAFDWQETPLQKPKQQGKGVLVFSENCKEFYGSYGTGDSTNNFGNWQGSNISK